MPGGGCILAIPSGFIVANTGSCSRFLRWPLVADNSDTTRVGHSLRGLVLGFPEFSAVDQPHRRLASHLGINV